MSEPTNTQIRRLSVRAVQKIIREKSSRNFGFLGTKFFLQDAIGEPRNASKQLPEYILSIWEDMTFPERAKLNRKQFHK